MSPSQYFTPLITPKVKRNKESFNDEHQDTSHGDYKTDAAQTKDINTTGEKGQGTYNEKEDKREFWKWMDSLYGTENIFLHKHDPLEHFPGTHPSLGPNLGSLKMLRRRAAEDKIRIELLKALTRAYDAGVITTPPTYAKIEVGGKEYTYEELPEHLLDEAFNKIINDTVAKGPVEDDAGNPEADVDAFTNAMENPPADLGLGGVTAAATFPTKWDIEGETVISQPEQTDNKSPVHTGPRWKKEIAPHRESKPYIQDGSGADDPEKANEDSLLSNVDVFFGM